RPAKTFQRSTSSTAPHSFSTLGGTLRSLPTISPAILFLAIGKPASSPPAPFSRSDLPLSRDVPLSMNACAQSGCRYCRLSFQPQQNTDEWNSDIRMDHQASPLLPP